MKRLLFLAVGVVLMITGCNGLLSGLFGTQRLRTMSVASAAGGVGDADYVRFTDGILLKSLCRSIREAGRTPVTACPLMPEGSIRHIRREPQNGRAYVVWWEGEIELPAETTTFEGFISPLPVDIPADWADKVPAEINASTSLHLGERPTAWYWQLAVLVGGIGLAAGSEAWAFRNRLESGDPLN